MNQAWPTPDELRWIESSPDMAAIQLRRYLKEAEMGVAHAPAMVSTILTELRANAARARGEDVPFVDPLGDFDQVSSNPLDERKLIIVYGDGETGKSTEVGKAFYRNNIPRPGGGVFPLGTALVASSDTVISPYADWYARNMEQARFLGNIPPTAPNAGGVRRTVWPEKEADGRTPFNVFSKAYEYVDRITTAQARQGDAFPYAGVVFDEFGTILDRALSYLMTIANDPNNAMFKSDKGKPNPGACYQAIQELIRTVCSLARRRADPRDPTGQKTVPPIYCVLVCHPIPKDDVKHPIGRAKMPSASAAQWLFNEADLFLRFYKEKLKLSEDTGMPRLGGHVEPQTTSQDDLLRSQLLVPSERWDAQHMVRRIQGSSTDAWAAKVRGWDAPVRYPLDLLALLRERGLLI